MSKIEWTNKTWNPTTGCNKVSQGCKMTALFLKVGKSKSGHLLDGKAHREFPTLQTIQQ